MNRRGLAGAVVVTSLALSAVPAFAGTQVKPKVVVFKAGVKSLSKSVGVGKSVTIDPRATTVPKGDGVTSFTIIFGDGATTKHKGGLTPLKHTYKKAGTYKVTLVVGDKHKKTVRTTVKLVVTAPKTVTPVVVTPVVVTPVATTPPVTPPAPVVTPDPTGPLVGIVRHNGVGVSGLLVVAELANGNTPSPSPYRTTTTSDGAYALQTPPGSYLLYVDMDPDERAAAPNPAFSAEAFSVTVPASGSTTVPVAIDAAVTVTGVVRDTRGAAAPSAVALYEGVGNATLLTSVQSTSNGAYTVTGASDTTNAGVTGSSGTDILLDFSPTSLYLQAGQLTPDLSMSGGGTAAQPVEQLADGSAVSGTVVRPDGSNAGSVNVALRDSSGQDYAEGVTASNGSFTIGGVPAGNYLVVANVPFADVGDYNATYAYNTPISVTTTTPATKPVPAGKATLRTPGTIAGKVVDATGAAVYNASIVLTTGDGVLFNVNTDGNGNYTLPGLPPSTTAYTITASTLDSNNDVDKQGTTTATVTASMTTTAPTITIS